LQERLKASDFDRLNPAESTREKRSAQTALWEILHVLIQRFAPITPFLSEQIYALTRGQSVDSSLPSIANPEESQSLSVFLEDWITQINISHIADAKARWKELVKRET
jgi:isoleucyl-tRNA synthetase